MERKPIVAQRAEEVLAEFNSHHDARGRLTTKGNAGRAREI
jgi:hypothetical protein